MRASLVFFASVFLALLATSATAKLEGPAWTELETKFRPLFKASGETEKKMEMLKALGSDDELRSWKLLGEAILLEAGHVTVLSEGLAKDLDALQVLLGMKRSAMYPKDLTELHRLQAAVSREERERGAEDRTLKAAVTAALNVREEGRKLILAADRGAKDWPARAAIARLAASSPEEAMSASVLSDSLEKEKDPRVKIAALEALQGASGTKWFPLIVGRINDPEWGVQLMAIRIAGSREMGKAIPALIQALAGCQPRVGEEIVAALLKLTGEKMEAYAEPWAKWWEANRSKWGEDGRPLQPIVSAPRASDIEIYGIKVKSSRVMFILDISGSMKEEKQAKPTTATPHKGPVTGEKPVKEPPPEPEKFSGPKIEIAKKELMRTLKSLPKEAMFDIIAYNYMVTQWQPKMMQATDANKELAYAWIRDMAPAGSTYTEGALQMAFKMAGMGAYDKAYPGVSVDTIFLLSDGAPTTNVEPYPPADVNEILQHVQEWNPQHRIIINCVGIDNVVQGIEFMKKLAAQNGGIYVDG